MGVDESDIQGNHVSEHDLLPLSRRTLQNEAELFPVADSEACELLRRQRGIVVQRNADQAFGQRHQGVHRVLIGPALQRFGQKPGVSPPFQPVPPLFGENNADFSDLTHRGKTHRPLGLLPALLPGEQHQAQKEQQQDGEDHQGSGRGCSDHCFQRTFSRTSTPAAAESAGIRTMKSQKTRFVWLRVRMIGV